MYFSTVEIFRFIGFISGIRVLFLEFRLYGCFKKILTTHNGLFDKMSRISNFSLNGAKGHLKGIELN